MPYQAARYRALCLMNKWEPFEEFVTRLYFDTTVYNQDAMELLREGRGRRQTSCSRRRCWAASRRSIRRRAAWFDDNKPCLDALGWLTEDDRRKIYEGNVRKAYPRLNAALERRAAAVVASR